MNESTNASDSEVRIEFLRPAEVERAQERCPTLFLPLGTIEWHGRHNVLGLDAVKAHALCVRAARKAGCVVHPPLYGGVGGLDEPFTFVIDREHDIESSYLRPWLEKLIQEAVRNGFKAVVVLTGHYGAAQQMTVKECAVYCSRKFRVPVLGTPEYMIALDAGYTGDHAAFFETSLMMDLHPGTADLSRLEGEPPFQGVGGRDPREANAADGARINAVIVERLAALAAAMPSWGGARLDAFIAAERAIVDRQFAAMKASGVDWEAWRKIGQGAFAGYGKALAAGNFGEVERLVGEL
jgi:creatinine amidohydrolase